mmetsp:Transcript_28003/g.40539  ORF Transcript_28003/g.40539 Transcript_28003/m.40539 type:complete len:157 (+) Transcript_28003:1101-1571(+)
MLLTSGRLSTDSKGIIETAYASEYASRGPTSALKLVQQLITTTPEFNSNNIAYKTGEKRVSATPAPAPYKAIVVLALNGGLDSFNVLTPHKSCPLFKSYAKERDDVKLEPDEMLMIDASSSENQPCTSFGVHHKIPIFKEIYEEGLGIFLQTHWPL